VNMGIALFSILLCCIVAEGVIRILNKDTMVLYPRYHTDAKYGEYRIRRLRPNSEFWHTSVDGSWKFTTNKQGFRSSYDFSYDKPPDVLRIIALGNSHTQGYEVRQDCTYPAIIEKYLSDHGYKTEKRLVTEYAIPTEELTEYKFQLASCLIERMYSLCKKNNVKLIIFTIPIIHPEYIWSPLPEEMYQATLKNCDIFVESEKVLRDYNNLIELRREHGSRHISEFTHCLLGVRIAKEIISKEAGL